MNLLRYTAQVRDTTISKLKGDINMKFFNEPELKFEKIEVYDVITTSIEENPNVGNPTPED